MQVNRIYFKGNPWPEGHPVKKFKWSAREKENDVWFDLHLESEDYYLERDFDDDDDVEYLSDWVSPIVWANYHSCTLSSTHWGNRGFKVCSSQQYSPEFLDGLEVEVDANPETIEDFDDFSFHIYLLGHDSAAKHKIRFERIGASLDFKIIWSGKIAQAYVGDYEYKHDFSVTLGRVEMPTIQKETS